VVTVKPEERVPMNIETASVEVVLGDGTDAATQIPNDGDKEG
jgi:hypothetical protein